MKKWKLTFIFFSGFILREVLGHAWLSVDGVLPFTSRIFGFTITPEMNIGFIIGNTAILFICSYFGFFYDWRGRAHKKMEHDHSKTMPV